MRLCKFSKLFRQTGAAPKIDPHDGWARVAGHPGPMALALGGLVKPEDWEILTQLCLSYSDAPGDQMVSVQLRQGDRRWEVKAAKTVKEYFRKWMI